jgi:hypothetical protein
MLVFKWQITAVWTGQTWDDYRANLMANRHIVLMLINDYNMTHYTWMMSQWVICIWSLCTRVVVLICTILSLCVMYNVKCLWFGMCRSIICFVLLESTMICMCTTIFFKQINRCVQPIICATPCICHLMDDFFLFCGHCCGYYIKYMCCLTY